MPSTKLEQSALSLLAAFESAGKSVSRVIVDGRRIELVLSKEHDADDFDRIDMRHDKT
jgi:predicted metalloenzyme YecM